MPKKKYLLSLEFDKVLSLVASCAKTTGGREKILNLSPFKKEEIEHATDLTSEAKTVLDEMGINSLPLLNVFDTDKILTNARLSADEIINLTKTMTTSRLVKNFLSSKKDALKLNLEYTETLISNKEFEDKIYNIFDENNNVKDNATPELKRLRTSYTGIISNLKKEIGNLLSDSSFTSHLQDMIYTERMGRTVFQVKASDKSKVKGIVHDVSASGQTFFIEPERLIGIHNKLRQTECEIEAEIERILFELSSEFHKIKPELNAAYNTLIEIDTVFAKAKYSILTKSNPATVSDKKIIKLFSARHPLIKENPVSNDFEIGENYKSLLITGSNTGGKTVTMKTVGLAVLMAEAGMHVLAENAEIYPFSNVYSDIEERQDITQSLSTFSAHIKNIAHILDNVTKDDLVLFDELGAGTDPAEGAALARAILEFLAQKDVITISTTHLGELKILEYQNNYFKNSCVEFDKETLKPTYKLIIGLAGSSFALDIAKTYGINEEITNKAKDFLIKNSDPNTNIFNKMQETHQELLYHTKKAEISSAAAKLNELAIKEKLKEIKDKKKKAIDSFKKKYQSNLENARKEIKETLEELRKEKSEKIARRAYARLAKTEERIRAEFSKDEDELSEKYKKINWDEIKIGQSVLVKGLNQPAILKTMPDEKNTVEIQMGLIKSKIHTSKLAHTDKKVSKGVKKLTVSFDDFHASSSFTPRLDLRGMRLEEAIDSLEHHLDLATRRNVSQFTVIHGHGTGALKKGLREYLADSPYVLKFRPGEDTEGGDGVSIIDVK